MIQDKKMKMAKKGLLGTLMAISDSKRYNLKQIFDQ